jgi:putative DNA primase/helicase
MNKPTKKITNMATAVAELDNLGIQAPKRVRELVSNARLPQGYSYRSVGQHLYLYYDETQLGRAIFVMADARDKDGSGWGKYLVVIDGDGKWHEVYIPYSGFMSSQATWLHTLADKGWHGTIDSSIRAHLKKFANDSLTGKRLRLINSLGWYEGVYVLPNKVIGTIKEEQPFLYPPVESKFKANGTLEDWQKTIGAWAVGNSRMMMAISATLATFLLRYYSWSESFGVHFYGNSSRGKTTTIQAAASCCGLGSTANGYISSWLSTANGIEGSAAQHNDAPLFLDEMGKADAKTVETSAYVIAGGQSKSRLTVNTTLQSKKAWRTIVISTGEKTFTGKLAEAGIKPQAGQVVRLLDVSAPKDSLHGFFEDIHADEFESGNAFANAIKQAAAAHYGHVAPAFIKRLIKAGHDEIAERLKNYLASNTAKLCGEGVDPQVERVSGHFLLCAFAGRLATEWGILPWKEGDAFSAVKACFQDWLATRGSTGAFEDKALITHVKRFIKTHDSRFHNLDARKSPGIRDRAGFKSRAKTGEMLYLFPRESFHREVCDGLSTTQAAIVLHRHGMLKKNAGDNYTIKRPTGNLKGEERQRCYAVIMPDEDE